MCSAYFMESLQCLLFPSLGSSQNSQILALVFSMQWNKTMGNTTNRNVSYLKLFHELTHC